MSQEPSPAELSRSITVEWQSGPPKGAVEVKDGELLGLEVLRGKGRISGCDFHFEGEGPFKLKLLAEGSPMRYETHPTTVSLRTGNQSFTFFLRDVNARFPIWIPEYGVVVTDADDQRSFDRVVGNIKSRDGR